MSLLADLCFKCKKTARSAITCNSCKNSFHPGCARDFVKNKSSTDCCWKQFNKLLPNVDTTVSGSRSSKMSNEEASPAIPSDWSSKSLDEKFTQIMTAIAASGEKTSLRLDQIENKMELLRQTQDTLNDKVSVIIGNVASNTSRISELYLKTNNLENMISSVEGKHGTSSSSLSALATSELMISGIPDVVSERLDLSDIVSNVFEKLKISELKTDILNIRKFENNKKSMASDNSGNAVLHSYILNLKSVQVRDFIINTKRKHKNLPVSMVFPTIVEKSFHGNIFVNEFLHPKVHKLLMNTKNKAKALRFRYVWVQNSQIFVKKDDNSEKLRIDCELDLGKLE